jgi:HK97 gp10 family phage protein
MKIGLSSKIDLSGLERFTDNLVPRLGQAVRQTAFAIEFDAKQNAPVDTGALRASIYTSTNQRSGYDEAVAQAVSRAMGEGDTLIQPAPEAPQPEDELNAIVAVGVHYAPYVEFGTHKAPAQPFLTPAAEQNRPFFRELVRDALREAGKSGGSVAPQVESLSKGQQPGAKRLDI